MAAVKESKPVEEVDDDNAMPEWKRQSVERSLQGPRARAQARTDRFVGAAMELMGESGNIDFTVQDVVDRSKMSIRTFYNFFASKDDLLVAVHETILATEVVPRMRAKCEAETDPIARVKAYVLGIYELTSNPGPASRALYDIQQPASRDQARRFGTSFQTADRARRRAHQRSHGVRPPAFLSEHGNGGAPRASHGSGNRARSDPGRRGGQRGSGDGCRSVDILLIGHRRPGGLRRGSTLRPRTHVRRGRRTNSPPLSAPPSPWRCGAGSRSSRSQALCTRQLCRTMARQGVDVQRASIVGLDGCSHVLPRRSSGTPTTLAPRTPGASSRTRSISAG